MRELELTLRLAHLVPDTEAEGPGRRFAIWTQGCPLRCPGCCNPEMLPLEGGTDWRVAELAQRAIETPGIEGLSLLGGEPFVQAAACAALAEIVREAGLSVVTFSGYTLAELRDPGADPSWARLLAATDLLVDGRYRRGRPERGRRWIGSANQELCFLSERYRSDDPRLAAANTVELRLDRAGLLVNGWPGTADDAVRMRR